MSQIDELKAILEQHVGKDNKITSREVQEHFGIREDASHPKSRKPDTFYYGHYRQKARHSSTAMNFRNDTGRINLRTTHSVSWSAFMPTEASAAAASKSAPSFCG